MARLEVRIAALALSVAAPSSALAQGVVIDHKEIGCVVVGQYPKMSACFTPASHVKKPRVYFRPETVTSWYYVEMTSDAPCFSGVLLRPSKALIDKKIFYYLDVQTEGSRTPEYAPVVVASEEDCKSRLPIAPVSATGPAAVYPSLPPGFLTGAGVSTGVVAGGVAAAGLVTGGVFLLKDDGGPSASTPSTLPVTSPPTTGPTTTAPPATVPAPGALVVACQATPRNGAAPLRVDFATFANGGTGFYAFEWAFGDGAGSTNPNPAHTFVTAGVFNATVLVHSGAQTAACSRAITVAPPPTTPPTTLPATFKLDVSQKGSGTGLVTGPGITCPLDCTETYPAGTVVNLIATPSSTRGATVFKDWAGDCSGTVNPCVLIMTADKNVTAQFELLRSLNLVAGANSVVAGSVTSSPAGTPPLTCAWTGALPPCLASATFINGTTVRLTVITGGTTVWAGCTTTAGPTCDVLMDANKSVSVDTR